MRPNVLLASKEVRGIDGTGGLGDVAIGLAKALRARGDVDVRLIMPGFEEVSGRDVPDRFARANRVLEGLEVPLGTERRRVDVYAISVPGSDVRCYLVRCPEVFGRDATTGVLNKDTADKAILFARAVVELLAVLGEFRVDVVHCNDWHAGLIPVYLKTLYRGDAYLGRIATVFTTHNAGGDAYQGGFTDPHRWLHLAGLAQAGVFTPATTRSLHHFDKFNFSKGGFGFADVLNTVSRQYRQELLTPAFAGGLEGLFAARAQAFTGIVNGIDVEEWDPARDGALGDHGYARDEPPDRVLAKKRAIRAALRAWTVPADRAHPRAGEQPYARLADDSVLIGVVTRIDYQKCPVLLGALDALCRIRSVQLAVLGNANPNDPLGQRYEARLRAAQSKRLLFFDGFDIPLSHLIYGASEAFLVPSVYEPCGLTQLVAMRYGSVPIARGVGGLVDTVVDEADASRATAANGFRFKEAVGPSRMVDEGTAAGLLVATVERALAVRERPRWRELVRNGMARDSSWTVPAAQYAKLYDDAMRRAVAEAFFA